MLRQVISAQIAREGLSHQAGEGLALACALFRCSPQSKEAVRRC